MLNALDALEAEKGISKEIVIDALEAALVSAYKRHYGQAQNVEVEFDQKKGKIHVYAVKEVTEEEVLDNKYQNTILMISNKKIRSNKKLEEFVNGKEHYVIGRFFCNGTLN